MVCTFFGFQCVFVIRQIRLNRYLRKSTVIHEIRPSIHYLFIQSTHPNSVFIASTLTSTSIHPCSIPQGSTLSRRLIIYPSDLYDERWPVICISRRHLGEYLRLLSRTRLLQLYKASWKGVIMIRTSPDIRPRLPRFGSRFLSVVRGGAFGGGA